MVEGSPRAQARATWPGPVPPRREAPMPGCTGAGLAYAAPAPAPEAATSAPDPARRGSWKTPASNSASPRPPRPPWPSRATSAPSTCCRTWAGLPPRTWTCGDRVGSPAWSGRSKPVWASTQPRCGRLRTWATRRGLTPSKTTAYLARTRDRRQLRFSVSGQPDIERAYHTHWVSPDLSARKAERLRKAAAQPPDLVVVDPLTEWTCAGCATSGEGLLLMQDDPTAPPALLPARPSNLPAGRRRDTHPTGASRQHPDRGRGPLQPDPQALRTTGSTRGTPCARSATALADRHRIALETARPGVVLRCGVLGVNTRGRRAPTARPQGAAACGDVIRSVEGEGVTRRGPTGPDRTASTCRSRRPVRSASPNNCENRAGDPHGPALLPRPPNATSMDAPFPGAALHRRPAAAVLDGHPAARGAEADPLPFRPSAAGCAYSARGSPGRGRTAPPRRPSAERGPTRATESAGTCSPARRTPTSSTGRTTATSDRSTRPRPPSWRTAVSAGRPPSRSGGDSRPGAATSGTG